MPARVADGRRHLPGLGEDEHPGEDPDSPVGRRRRLAQPVVQNLDALRPDLPERLLSQGQQDVVPDRHPVALRRARLAADRDLVPAAALRETGDGGLRHRLRGEWLLARLIRSMTTAASRRCLARMQGAARWRRADLFRCTKGLPHMCRKTSGRISVCRQHLLCPDLTRGDHDVPPRADCHGTTSRYAGQTSMRVSNPPCIMRLPSNGMGFAV